jgi:filamentous hemagglutinin
MSKAIDVFNELAAHFASAGDEESALLFSNIARHNLTIAKDFLKDLASASVNATPKALLRLTSPEHWTGFATSTAECAFNIASTLGESIEASESFSLDQLNTLDKRYHERAEILKRTIAAHIQNVKAMSRQQLLERGIEEGIVFFGDFIACKGLSLLAHGNLTERAFVELDATTAQLQKVLRNADPLTQHHVMEIVNCGKIRLECGQSIGEEALSCLGDTPELLNQNGKTVSQVVEEVAGEVATRVEQKVSTAVDASTPVGRRGMNPTPRVQNGLRTPTIIYGREYSAHAIERIQERGLTPMVVENAIKTGLTKQNKLPGNLEHFDEINNITVITCEKTGKVVTVF